MDIQEFLYKLGERRRQAKSNRNSTAEAIDQVLPRETHDSRVLNDYNRQLADPYAADGEEHEQALINQPSQAKEFCDRAQELSQQTTHSQAIELSFKGPPNREVSPIVTSAEPASLVQLAYQGFNEPKKMQTQGISLDDPLNAAGDCSTGLIPEERTPKPRETKERTSRRPTKASKGSVNDTRSLGVRINQSDYQLSLQTPKGRAGPAVWRPGSGFDGYVLRSGLKPLKRRKYRTMDPEQVRYPLPLEKFPTHKYPQRELSRSAGLPSQQACVGEIVTSSSTVTNRSPCLKGSSLSKGKHILPLAGESFVRISKESKVVIYTGKEIPDSQAPQGEEPSFRGFLAPVLAQYIRGVPQFTI